MAITKEAMDTIQLITNIFTSFGIVVALIVLILEIRKNTESKQFDSFVKLLEQYENLVSKRKDRFHKIAEKVRENPKTKDEMHDKQNSLSYLLIRLGQQEPFFAIEHEILDLEIKCLSYLNELCGMSLSNDRAKQILLLKEPNEITYYKTRLDDLMRLYESEKKIRRFHVPKFDNLQKISVEEYFDQTKF